MLIGFFLVLAIPLAFLAYRVARNWPKAQWSVLQGQGDLASKQCEWDKAARILSNALEVAAKLPPRARKLFTSQTQLRLGIVRYHQNRTEEARELFQRSIQMVESAGLAPAASDAKRQLGLIEADQGEFTQALAWMNRALEDDRKIGNEGQQIFDLQLLGHAALDMGDSAQALEYFTRCEELERKVILLIAAQKGQDLNRGTVISMSLPDIRFAQGRFEEAEKLLKEKVANYSKYVMREDNIDLGRFAFRYAQCVRENGKPAEAIRAMEDAADFYRKEWAPDHPRVLRCVREIERMRQAMPASAELQNT